MAVYKIFPEKDAFIFSDSPLANAGKDEIVEIAGYADISGTGQTSRILVKYNTEEIQQVITDKIGVNPYSASLHFYLADAYEMPIDFKLYTYPVYSPTGWDNGIGKYGDIPVDKSGVSWKYRQAGETNEWLTSVYPTGVTASFLDTAAGGGNWYTGSAGINLEFTQSFNNSSEYDTDINVTSAVEMFVDESLDNEGFILKLHEDLEFNTTSSIRLKYFGGDTNTVYLPCLELKWDDSTYDVGTLDTLSTDIAMITVTNNKGKYIDQGVQRFKINAKPKYPVRTFTTSSVYLTNYALPEASYWGIKDEYTEEMVVDFSTEFTKISCDSTGPYFDVYMDGLQPERYYRILIKTELDGSTTVIDNQNIFKVVRNG